MTPPLQMKLLRLSEEITQRRAPLARSHLRALSLLASIVPVFAAICLLGATGWLSLLTGTVLTALAAGVSLAAIASTWRSFGALRASALALEQHNTSLVTSLTASKDALEQRMTSLEQHNALLEASGREMKFVLDHVHQSFLSTDLSGRLLGAHGPAILHGFGPLSRGQPLWTFIEDDRFAKRLELGWLALIDDLLPRDLLLEQLPRRLQCGEYTQQLGYQRIEDRYLVTVDDVTEKLAREKAQTLRHEALAVLEQIAQDKTSFVAFVEDTSRHIARLCANPCPLDAQGCQQLVHTLKGTAGMFGVSSLAEVCDEVEMRSHDAGLPLCRDDFLKISAVWDAAGQRLGPLLGSAPSGLEVSEGDYTALLTALRGGRPATELEQMLLDWRREPVARRFERLASHASQLASQLEIRDFEVAISGGEIRLERDRLMPLWSSLVHLVRNALDHGLRSVPNPRLVLEAIDAREGVEIHVWDNGVGIDWQRIAERARQRGLPADSYRDLVSALFTDGLSTRDVVTELSGQGVGLGAVRRACDDLDIAWRVTSERGEGTRFSFLIPQTFV